MNDGLKDILIEDLWYYFHDIRNVDKSFPEIHNDLKNLINEVFKNG